MRGCAILLPAAGAATRMRGRDKLLEPVDGQPILRHVARLALTVSANLAVSLRDPDPARHKSLEGLPLARLCLPDASEGMAASLRAGASWAMGLPVGALMIALPDMPDLTAQDLRALIATQAANPSEALRASDMAGRAGHPVILPRRLFADMLQLRGDQGARQILRRHPPRLHALKGKRALTDLDTPEAWAAWRAGAH